MTHVELGRWRFPPGATGGGGGYETCAGVRLGVVTLGLAAACAEPPGDLPGQSGEQALIRNAKNGGDYRALVPVFWHDRKSAGNAPLFSIEPDADQHQSRRMLCGYDVRWTRGSSGVTITSQMPLTAQVRSVQEIGSVATTEWQFVAHILGGTEGHPSRSNANDKDLGAAKSTDIQLASDAKLDKTIIPLIQKSPKTSWLVDCPKTFFGAQHHVKLRSFSAAAQASVKAQR